MNYNILSYRKLFETKTDSSKSRFQSNDLINNYISTTNQISKLYHYRNENILEEITCNTIYQKTLFNILINDTPFKNFFKKFKFDLATELQYFRTFGETKISGSDNLPNETLSSKPQKKSKTIEKCQNQMIDGSISKIIKILLSTVKPYLRLVGNDPEIEQDVFRVIEESIRDLPLLILSKAINESHESSINEIKQFIQDMIRSIGNEWSRRKAMEIWLLLFTRMGGLDNILEWFNLVINRLNVGEDFMIRTEILSNVLESLLINDTKLTVEMKDHVKDCLVIDILDQETMGLDQAISCLFAGILRACKIHLKTNIDILETDIVKSDSKSDIFKDIYIWEHGNELQNTKAPYPDSLLIRLNPSNENHSIKQVICSQTELIVVNSLGQVRSKTISNRNENQHENITKLLNHCWSPINFPDMNCKIDQMSIGWEEENETQHILALSKNGQVYSWGGGSYGKLGHGDLSDRHSPVLIEALRGYNLKSISCGTALSAAVSVTGLVFVWGDLVSANGEENEICLRPKRLQQGIMSQIICGPHSAFLLSINKRNIYYLGSKYDENVLYSSELNLPRYPSTIEGLQFIISDKNESIKKVAANSSGLVVLLNNGDLFSIGRGLVLGCPNCQIHKSFERVKSMSDINAIDVVVSETHVVVLSHGVIYSWSLTVKTLVLVQETFKYSLTSISAAWLISHKKQINVAWSKNYESYQNSTSSSHQNSNSYLSILSPSISIKHFNDILNKSIGLVKSSKIHEQIVMNTLKLLLHCLKSNQLVNLYDDYANIKIETDMLVKTILFIGDYDGINEQIKEITCTILLDVSSTFYQNCEDKAEFVCEILASSKPLSLMTFCSRYLLKNLILTFNDPTKEIPPYNRLFQLPLSKLDDLLISICKTISTNTISILQDRKSISKTEYCVDSFADLCALLNQFATVGYRIYISFLCQKDTHNPIGNLCSLLPLTNTIIGCLKSYLQHTSKFQKISSWIKTNGTQINLLLSQSPMCWILFDILNYLIEQNKWDILPLIPHLERLIISLDSINVLLPQTTLNDAQETQWSFYGFQGCPNISNVVPEPGSSWLWLLDLQRLTGLVVGELFKRELIMTANEDNNLNNINLFTKWLKAPLFRHISMLPVHQTYQNNRCQQLESNYNDFLRIMTIHGDNFYYAWSEQSLLFSTGLNIYSCTFYLFNTEYPNIDVDFLKKSIFVYESTRRTFNLVMKHLTGFIGIDYFYRGIQMTEDQEKLFRKYIEIINLKCTFLISLSKDSFTNDTIDKVIESKSVLVDALDLSFKHKMQNFYFKFPQIKSWKSLDKISHLDDSNHKITDMIGFLKKIQESLEDFLVQENLMNVSLDEDLIESTNLFLQNLSFKIYFKRKTNNRVSIILKSLYKLLDSSKLSIDSVLIQILNSMLVTSQVIAAQIHPCHYDFLEKICFIILDRINQFSQQTMKSDLSQRSLVTFINFLSQFNCGLINLINVLIDGNFLGTIFGLTQKTPFINTGKWLIIEGNGDNNLPNVCNIIGWCIFENFLLNISVHCEDISDNRMRILETQLRNFVSKMYTEICTGNKSKIIDLHATLNTISYLYKKSMSFKKFCYCAVWTEILLKISNHFCHLQGKSPFLSKYTLNLVGINFLFSIMEFETHRINEDSKRNTQKWIAEIFQSFSDLFYYLITKSSKLDTKTVIDSINVRINIYKQFCENIDTSENALEFDWLIGNSNFDKLNSWNCDFVTSDKISIISSFSFKNFLALSCEDLTCGIWRVTFEVECKENKIDFSYGFLANDKKQWPTDKDSLVKILKLNSPTSISCRTSVSRRFSCIIDIDQFLIFFSDGDETVRSFNYNDKVFRFFIASSSNRSNSFQIQMISIKELAYSDMGSNVAYYHNVLLSPDHYAVLDALYSGFNKLFTLNPQWIQEFIVRNFIEHSDCFQNKDLYFDKNISTPVISSSVMFGLFLLNNRITNQGFYRGETCLFSSSENNMYSLEKGTILDFKMNVKIQFNGLNFLDKLIKTSDISCSICTLNSRNMVILPLRNLQKDNKCYKSVFLQKIKEYISINIDVIGLLIALLNCTPKNYFDVDITNYEKMEWSSKVSERSDVEYHFIKCLSSRLLMQILSKTVIINTYLASKDERAIKILEKLFNMVTSLASKPSPIRKVMNLHGFQCASYKLFESFYQIHGENELGLVKKYANLYMKNHQLVDLRVYLCKNERNNLLRALQKQPFGQNLIESFKTKMSDNVQSVDLRGVTFSNRRRKVVDYSIQMQVIQDQTPADEYDSYIDQATEHLDENESVLLPETNNDIPQIDVNQRTMDEFVLRTVNKNKKTSACPICDIVIKWHIQSIFSHLSIEHPHNCRKTFKHHATQSIKADGTLAVLENDTLYCASVVSNGYAVCDEYLKNKVFNKCSSYHSEDFTVFVNEGYITNVLIGLSGTLSTEEFSYQKISNIRLSEDIRPKLDQVKILGEHIHQEINYSRNLLEFSVNEKHFSDDCLFEEISFICQLNAAAIIKALHRLEYSCLIIDSRNLIVKLVKLIFQKSSKSDAIAMSRRFFLTDSVVVLDIIRLIEGGRMQLNTKNRPTLNDVKCIDFKNSDFLSVLLMGLEADLKNSENIHSFVVNYLQMLENCLTCDSFFFALNIEFDASILNRPSTTLMQILFDIVVKVLFPKDCFIDRYECWQTDVELLMELLAFGVICSTTISKVKIWCLSKLMKMFKLIETQKLTKKSEFINMVDLCDDLSMEDSPTIHLANCNATVKKLISVMNRQNILTADCEGTMRLWDIDFTIGADQNLRQTFLFSIGDHIPRASSTERECSEMMDTCLRVAEPLRVDLSNYLVQAGVQKIAVSPAGYYLAESLGVYLNIWSTKSIYSKPYVISFASLITALIFPQQTFSGLLGSPVDLLLVGLADGDLILLRIFDNGTRVTQHQIPGFTNIESSVTTVAWDGEKNPIFIGYHDGSIAMTDQQNEKIILETVHNNRIYILLYCPYTTESGLTLLASSSVDEDKISIWKLDRQLCILSLSAPITCMEWLTKKFITDDNHYIIIAGTSTGLIQFWQFDHSGQSIQNLITFCGHLCAILKLKVCENTNLLASGCNNGWVNVWSIKDRSLISTCRGDGYVIGIDWTPQNNLVAAFSRSQYIKIWKYFNGKTLQKNGIRQWAHVRKLFLQSTNTKSIKHLKNLKYLSLSLHKLLGEQFLEEIQSVKCGFSIVFSQYFQMLIQFTISLNFIPKLIPCSSKEAIDVENYSKPSYLLEVDMENVGQRHSLLHHLNLINKISLNPDFDWLLCVDETINVTKFICFEKDFPADFVPKWWWAWCVGSDEYIHHYVQSKWKNRFWSMDKQIELFQWYQHFPEDWITEYSNSTYIWGCGIKGELSFSSNADWVKPTLIKIDGIQQVVCGSGVTLILTCEDKLMACGEGLEIIFNPFMREEAFRIINVPVLNDYKITHVSASRGPESHIIAITSFGEVFSWGIGSYGKLGHGHATTLKKPKLIETLRGKGAIMSDCGYMHSAVVTASGELYTFGLGANGQLGIEILSGCDTPRLVDFGDLNLKIGMVACGMHHTLALSTDGFSLWAFGEGVYGKLGVGDFNDRFSPTLVDLKQKSLLKIVCGKHFSAALDSNGGVLTWGHSDFIGMHIQCPEDTCEDTSPSHMPFPCINKSLGTYGCIVDICAGNDTTFVLTSSGSLYGWGSNYNNILRLGSKSHAYIPELIAIKRNIHFRQVSCGRFHACASSHAPYSYRNNIPTGPQLKHNASSETSLKKYPALNNSDLNMFDMTSRLILLLYWNELVRLTWQFWLPQTNQHYDLSDYSYNYFKYSMAPLESWPFTNSSYNLFSQSNWMFEPFNHFQKDEVRQLLNNELVASSVYRYLNASMINNRTYNSLVRIDRIDKKESVFMQTCRQILSMDVTDLRLPWRAWKVKLVNEGADDAGGAYDETISEICNELESDYLSPRVLIPISSDVNTFLPNPDPSIPMQHFHFLGILMATAIRTKKPIHLHLDPLFWKRLTKSTVTIDDLLRIDPAYFNSLLSMKEDNNKGDGYLQEIYALDKFISFSSNSIETEVIYKGSKRTVENSNLSIFVNNSIYYRLHEYDNAIENIRKSFCNIAPMVLLDIMNWKQLEKMVCGSKSISIEILKSIARYVDVEETDVIISWFWEILESFTESEKSLFLRFVTGKSRLPSQDSHIPFRLFIYISKQSPNSLPQSQTCFNQIRLPRYNSRAEMETRLRIAISQCRSIDMDDYMLIRNREE